MPLLLLLLFSVSNTLSAKVGQDISESIQVDQRDKLVRYASISDDFFSRAYCIIRLSGQLCRYLWTCGGGFIATNTAVKEKGDFRCALPGRWVCGLETMSALRCGIKSGRGDVWW